MADYLTIQGKQYRVASNVMGVTLGLLESYGGKMPDNFGAATWAQLLNLSIYWGEHMEGRESTFSLDEFCTMPIEEAREVLTEFQDIYLRQNNIGEGDEPKKK